MLDHEPEIVHFCGMARGESGRGSGRAVEDGTGSRQGGSRRARFRGRSRRSPTDLRGRLGRLFELCAEPCEVRGLNACYSESQADAISKHIDYVVGMKKAIGDEAAIKFAVGFYDALAAGRNFGLAFKFGCIAIDLKGIPESQTPVLLGPSGRN